MTIIGMFFLQERFGFWKLYTASPFENHDKAADLVKIRARSPVQASPLRALPNPHPFWNKFRLGSKGRKEAPEKDPHRRMFFFVWYVGVV